MLKAPMSLVAKASQVEFALSLFPIQSADDPLELFYKNMVTYFHLRMDKRLTFQEVINEVIGKAKEKHSGLHQILG